jgi:hypothetical protein
MQSTGVAFTTLHFHHDLLMAHFASVFVTGKPFRPSVI